MLLDTNRNTMLFDIQYLDSPLGEGVVKDTRGPTNFPVPL